MVAFTLNGAAVEAADAPDTPLLWVVRDTFELKGSKFGCGAGLCGACTLPWMALPSVHACCPSGGSPARRC